MVEDITEDTVVAGETLTHTVTLNEANAIDQTLYFTLTEDTAIGGEDFNTTPVFTEGVTLDTETGYLTVPAGVSSFDISITSLVNSEATEDRSYYIKVRNYKTTGTITIE